MKRNLTISLLLGAAISAVTLYLAFRNVPLGDLVRYLGSINYFWVLPSVMAVLLSFVVRVFRWQVILRSAREIPFWSAYHPLMIGFMMNCILPGRIGEIARPVILQRREKVPFTTGLATVAAERVFDVAMLVAFLAVVLVFVQIDPDLEMTFGGHLLNRETLEAIAGGMLKLCLILIAGIVLVSIESTRRAIDRIIMKTPGVLFFLSQEGKRKVEQKIAAPLVRITENFAAGFALIRYPGRIVLCLGFSITIWLLQAVSYYLVALGCPGIGLSFFEISAVMIIVCFFIALPSVPGFWGLWEAGGVFALALFGIPAKEAAGFTLANHAIQMFPVILVGLVSAVQTGINIWQVSLQTRSQVTSMDPATTPKPSEP